MSPGSGSGVSLEAVLLIVSVPGVFGSPRFDVSLVKHTRVGEKKDIEFRANALNAFNLTNFFLVPNGAGNITVNSLAFGQTTNAYRDYNSTNDTGARMVEFALRFTF